MPEWDNCDGCGKFTIVHGNRGYPYDLGQHVMLCDDCCPCHNHCPPLYGKGSGGKYYYLSMRERLGLDVIDIDRERLKQYMYQG